MFAKKIYSLILLLCCISFGAKAQIALAYNDTTLCPGQTITMCAALTGQADALSSDDEPSGIIDIGFPFVFFGNTFSKCVASGNGMINFDTTTAAMFSWGWTWPQITVSTPVVANNAIFATFCDLYLPAGGKLRYQRFGSVGSRKFIIEWCQIPVFSGVCTTAVVTTQIILNEGTNIIEIHTTQLPAIGPNCPGASGPSNFQQVIQGVRNSNGTAQFFPVNRDPTVSATNWGVTGVSNDAMRFTPTTTTTYTMAAIPFAPWTIIDSIYSPNLKWYAPNTTVPFATGACASTTVQPGVNYYTVHYDGIAGCAADTQHLTDTVHILYGARYDTLNVDICQGSTYNFYGHVYNQTGQYDTSFSTVGGCDSIITLNLFVNQYPNVALADTNSFKILCKGVSGLIAIANPSPTYSYQWYRNDSLLTGQTASSITSPIAGDYKVVVTTNKGCTSTSKVTTFQIDAIHVDFDFTLHKGCSDDTVQFTNLSTINSKYKWDFGDLTYPYDSTRNPNHLYLTQGNYPVDLVVTDTNGCMDSTLKFVNTQHPLHAAFTQSVDTICQDAGTPVVFTDGSVGATNWAWDFGDGGSSTQQSPSHVYTLSGVHPVKLTIHDDVPCYDSVSHNIQIDSVPFLTYTQDKHALCEGDKVNFTADYLQTATNLSWNFGDNTSWNQLGNTSHSYDHAGIYVTTLIGDYGVCGTVTHTDSVVVSSFPVVNLGPDTVLCLDGPSILVTNLSGTADPTVHWLWSTGATTPSIAINAVGTYSLTATRGDCATTENIIVNKDCYTDIPNAFTPNGDGVNDYFYPRQLLSKGVVAFTMTVFDRWGMKVFETNVTDGRGWDGKFNGKDQPGGVYIYQMSAVLKNGHSENYTGNITLIR